jgi:hypothetical protein
MFKSIPGFSHYMVDENGTVKSLYRNTILSQKTDKYGYKIVTLFEKGKSRCIGVHRLVAMAFIPNPFNKPTVNHINENKSDNRVNNLEWMTVKENDNHGTRNSRIAKSKCRKQVVAIYPDGRKEYFSGVKDAERHTGIYHSNIAHCCQGKPNRYAMKWRYADEME